MPVEEWKREARTEKTRRANFPIVDDARERDQGELAATFRSYMMLVSFLSGASTHLGPLASTLRAKGRRDRSILINMQPKECVDAPLSKECVDAPL
jgi:hypothetical protein